MSAVIECKDIHKVYTEGPQDVAVLNGVSLQIEAGEQLAIVGSSGSGKTTLLNMLGGLDLPTSGQVLVSGKDLATVSETERGYLRNKYLGFVYQFHHLLNEFSAAENVAMPLLIAGIENAEVKQRCKAILARVGLENRADHKPAELSGGERQRVAIARALVTEPACVLLDEPTGNLDRGTALEIQSLMAELNRNLNTSFVIVTHDEGFASSLGRKLELKDGVLHE